MRPEARSLPLCSTKCLTAKDGEDRREKLLSDADRRSGREALRRNRHTSSALGDGDRFAEHEAEPGFRR
jgi:hypothetical protein